MSSIAGASSWEQDLYDHVSSHADNERDVIEEYRELAANASASVAFRYLANLILEDELRHHRMIAELAESIRHRAELRPGEPPIPSVVTFADREALLAATGRFLAIEREDAVELKRLAREMKDVRDTTMWVLLVRLMQDDTEKHIRILEFLRDRLRHPV